jgi:uncharacterized membrane protein YoaK (UPF0700 family)
MPSVDDRSQPPIERGRDLSLVLLAASAGVVDAICLTTLGVFTAAVSANAVLVGLSLGDADPHTAGRAAVAFAAFGIGVAVGARMMRVESGGRPSRVIEALAAIIAFQAAFLTGWLLSGGHPEGVTLDLLAATSALAMGGQTAAARAWHTRGVTTTYISGTLTLLLTDVAAQSESRADLRRVAVILSIVAGATVGALMLTHARDAVAVVPLSVTVLVALGAGALLRRYSGSRSASASGSGSGSGSS